MHIVYTRSGLNLQGAVPKALVRIGLVLILFCHVLPASGRAKTLTVACPQQTISAAVATLKPAADYQVINVSGACAENVYIPSGLSVSIVGASGASLSPGPAAFTTIDVQGRLYLYGLAVQTQPGVGIFVQDGAYASLVGGTITGPGVGVQVSDHSGVVLQNETVAVTGQSAVGTYNNGTVEIDGVTPFNSATGSALSSGGVGINCNSGTLTLNASGAPISIANNTGDGIYLAGCNLIDFVSAGQTISISGNGGNGIGAFQAASATIGGMKITGNQGNAIYAQVNAGVLLTGGNVLTGNTGPAIQSSENATIFIQGFSGGANTISESKGNTNVLFSCYQGGKIFVTQVSGNIMPAPTGNTTGCLTVGGP